MADIRPFCMPKWGIEMTEGTIAEWMVQEGQAFTRGQVICLIETDKITNEVEAEYDAVLKRVLVPASDQPHPVGALLGVFADAAATDAEVDAFIASFKPAETGVAAKATSAEAAPAAAAPEPAPAAAAAEPKKIVTNRPISPEALKLAEANGVDIEPIQGSGRGGRITYQDVVQAMRPERAFQPQGPAELPAETRAVFASPLAARLAAQYGIDLSTLKGTGPRGRISKADVLGAVKPAVPEAAPAPVFGAPFVAVANTPVVQPFDKVRKVVARRLTEAKQTIPHFYLRVSARVDELVALRKTANVVMGTKASINDYLVKAVAMALVRHPDINVQVAADAVHSFPHADVAIAVASPKGLVTPIVRQADRMHIAQIAATTRALIDKAQAGRLSFEDMDGGTFSISNLGMMGIEEFDAIINPPQGAILAVGGVGRVAVETADGDIAFESQIKLSLSVDHRAIDGAAGASFLQTLKALIEAPESLFS